MISSAAQGRLKPPGVAADKVKLYVAAAIVRRWTSLYGGRERTPE